MSVVYQDNLENADFPALCSFLRKHSGTGKSAGEDTVRKAFEKSRHVVLAVEDGRIVGAVRAISDGDWAVLYDFAVEKAFAGTEVEKEVLRRILQPLKGQHIFANAETGKLGFFEENGFLRSKTAFTYVGESGKDPGAPEGFFLPLHFRFENEFREVSLPFPTKRKPEKRRAVSLTYTSSREGLDYERAAVIIAEAFGGGKKEKTDPEERIPEDKIRRTKELFAMSEYASFAYDGENLVGVARAITDGAREAYIQNVAVDPDYQGYGIGWQIVVNLGEEIRKNGLVPFLHTHPGAVGFYNRKGFLRNKTAVDYIDSPDHRPQMPAEVERGFYLPQGFRFADELVPEEKETEGGLRPAAGI